MIKYLVIILFLPWIVWANEDDAPPKRKDPVYFFRMNVSQQEKNRSTVFFGQVKPESFTIWEGGGSILHLKYKTHEELQREALKKKEKEALKKELEPVSAEKTFAPILEYKIKKSELSKCTEIREFKFFIMQLPQLSDLVRDLTIHVGGTEARDCAARVKSRIEPTGIPVRVSQGPFSEKGVLIRGTLNLGEEGPQVQDEPRLGRVPTELVIIPSKGEPINVLVRPDGYFIKSFKKSELKNLFPMAVKYLGKEGAIENHFMQALPEVRVGENKINFNNTQAAQVIAFKWDEVERLEVPEIIEQKIVQRRVADKFTLGARAGWSTFSTNAFPKGQSGLTPLEAEGYLKINRMFAINSSLRAPLTFGKEPVKFLFADAQLHSYLLTEDEDKPRWMVGLAVGGFFYSADAKQVPMPATTNILSQFLGFQVGGVARVKMDESIGLEAQALFSPLVETIYNKFSLSYQYSANMVFSLDEETAVFVGYRMENFKLISKLSNEYYFKTLTYGAGYRMNLF